MNLRSESGWTLSQAQSHMSRIRRLADTTRESRQRHDRDTLLTVSAQIKVIENEMNLLDELIRVAEL